MSVGTLPEKRFSRAYAPLEEMPNLVQHQTDSYKKFIEEGIRNMLSEFSPISDYAEKKFDLEFKEIEVTYPDYNEFHAKENKISYECTLKVNVKLTNKITGSEKEQELFFTDIPIMTDHGTFIVNGVEKVLVPQLARSFGIFFTADDTKSRRLFGAKIIPARGSWLEFETDTNDIPFVKIDRKRKIPVTSLMRVFGGGTNEEILSHFETDEEKRFIENAFKKDVAISTEDSYVEIYKRLRDGEMVAPQHAKEFIDSLFKSIDRYDLSEVGRVRFNRRFKKEFKEYNDENRLISLDDLVKIVKKIVELSNDREGQPDDIDHLGSRRLRFFDEMIAQKFRLGILQMKRNIQDRMSISDSDVVNPQHFINPRPLQARIKEFFNTNQLCQFMDQDNILSEIEKLRTVSALGQGGLVRERAGFEVRDVHPSHYGRLCPIQTPEGQNIGLILRMSVYATVNKFGVIETPYAVVKNGKITDEIKYIDAYEEEMANIAHSGTKRDEKGNFTEDRVDVRFEGDPRVVSKEEVDFIDISSYQPFSVATSMIPFVNHNEANRALMGSNMQKQAVPCLVPDAPLVATGMEKMAARFTGRLIYAPADGEITYADARKVTFKQDGKKEKTYDLVTFSKTNNNTNFHQRPVVMPGQKVKEGDLLVDASTSDNGQIAVGQNMLVAFLSFYGNNFEDAIIVSERLVKNAKFTNIYISEQSVEVRDTKLGPEQTTHDIPNVSETKLRFLDEDGIIKVGAEVESGDILVGKITPKGESQLTPEERLLRSIFGDKARDVKDTSLRYKGASKARVVSVKIFDRSKGEIGDSGVIKRIYIQLAELRNISVGDKLSGRHGNKGVISKILPEEDMPYTKDGRPVDVILTPLGVPSRMNLGQILELHLGLAADSLGYQAIVPPFAGATTEEIEGELVEAGFKKSGKMPLIDGITGEYFAQDVSVGYMYMLKLHHMIEDKLHMRSIGPYSLINQQPLGGKAQNGGQRFGEMEVWALLGHGAAYTLREVLTVKSDDIMGRSAMYDSIVKGEKAILPNTPESFNVMMNMLKGLALNVDLEGSDND